MDGVREEGEKKGLTIPSRNNNPPNVFVRCADRRYVHRRRITKSKNIAVDGVRQHLYQPHWSWAEILTIPPHSDHQRPRRGRQDVAELAFGIPGGF